jgi:hypothetical protein
MSEEQHEKQISRREFLKGTLKTTGYVLPAIAVIKLNTVDAWANSYGREQTPSQNTKGKHEDPCNGFFEKIFNTRCWW